MGNKWSSIFRKFLKIKRLINKFSITIQILSSNNNENDNNYSIKWYIFKLTSTFCYYIRIYDLSAY